MAEPAPWSWSKWFGGFIEGRRYGKDFAILLRLTVLAGIGILLFSGILMLKERFMPGKGEAKPSVGVIDSGGAPVDNSTKKTFWSLFYFGGQNQ